MGISGLGQADGFFKKEQQQHPISYFRDLFTGVQSQGYRDMAPTLLFGEQQPPFELTHKVQAMMTTPYREKKKS